MNTTEQLTCPNCGKPMRHSIPRYSLASGLVHAETGSLLCGDEPETPRMIGGIVIPTRPPPGVVTALRNFVEAIEAYGETVVWPDNGTLRRLAEEGRDALNCGHSKKS